MIRLDLIIVLAITVLLVAATVILFRLAKPAAERYRVKQDAKYTYTKHDYSIWDSHFAFTGAMVGSLAGIMALILAGLTFPFHPTYWFYQEHSGEIESISNRFADASGDISSGTYTLTVGGKALVVEDPRVLTYQVGDDIDLNCLPSFVYGAADRLYCNIR